MLLKILGVGNCSIIVFFISHTIRTVVCSRGCALSEGVDGTLRFPHRVPRIPLRGRHSVPKVRRGVRLRPDG